MTRTAPVLAAMLFESVLTLVSDHVARARRRLGWSAQPLNTSRRDEEHLASGGGQDGAAGTSGSARGGAHATGPPADKP